MACGTRGTSARRVLVRGPSWRTRGGRPAPRPRRRNPLETAEPASVAAGASPGRRGRLHDALLRHPAATRDLVCSDGLAGRAIGGLAGVFLCALDPWARQEGLARARRSRVRGGTAAFRARGGAAHRRTVDLRVHAPTQSAPATSSQGRGSSPPARCWSGRTALGARVTNAFPRPPRPRPERSRRPSGSSEREPPAYGAEFLSGSLFERPVRR